MAQGVNYPTKDGDLRGGRVEPFQGSQKGNGEKWKLL